MHAKEQHDSLLFVVWESLSFLAQYLSLLSNEQRHTTLTQTPQAH